MQESLKQTMSEISVFFEVVGVAVIFVGFFVAVGLAFRRRSELGEAYQILRSTFGRSILLGLEVLVAADLIRTIAVEPNLQNIAVLGALVVLRTFLSWSLELEVSGHWPWQHPVAPASPRVDEPGQ